MYRYTIKGFERKLLPSLAVFFLVLLTISIVEATYFTQYGTILNYILIFTILSVVMIYIYVAAFFVLEYLQVGDVFSVRIFHRGKLRKTHVVHLHNPDVRFYKGINRYFNGIFYRRKLCYLPFFGGLFRMAAICYLDGKGRPTKLIFKSTPEMSAALEYRITNKPPEPENDIFN